MTEFLYETSDGEAEITGYNGDEKDITVPGEIDGYKVSKIGEYAFSAKDITSVSLPGGIKEIGDFAFYFCENLSRLKLNDGLETIGESFAEFTQIKEILLPDSVSEIKDVRGVGFGIITGNSDYYYGDGTGFYKKSGKELRLLKISPESAEEEYELNAGTVSVDVTAFENSRLKRIIIPAGVRDIPAGALSASDSETDIITDIRVSPDNKNYKVTDGSLYSVYDSGLTLVRYFGKSKDVICAPGTEYIGEKAFYRKDIDSLSFPDSFQTADDNAFAGCSIKNLSFSDGTVLALPAGNTMVCRLLLDNVFGKDVISFDGYDNYLLTASFDSDLAEMIFTRLKNPGSTLSAELSDKLKSTVISHLDDILYHSVKTPNITLFKEMTESGILTADDCDKILDGISSYDEKYSAITVEMKKILLVYKRGLNKEFDFSI